MLQEQPEVKVEVLRCDVSDEVALNEMLSEVRRAGPIEGIVHSAGVLRDALIRDGGAESGSAEVWNSKARSARLLHESTASDDLKLFLTYSSISAAYGNVGQAAYGAANAYLDALMEERVIAGQCGLSVQWPAISGVGMAAAALAMSGNRDGGRGILTEGTASPEDVDQLITDILSGKAGTGRSPVLQMAPKPMVTMMASLGIHLKHQLGKVLRAIEATEAPIARAGKHNKPSVGSQDKGATYTAEQVRNIVRNAVTSLVGEEDVDEDATLMDEGLDSRATELSSKLSGRARGTRHTNTDI